MIKKMTLFLLICLSTLLISGCWDYRGLDEHEIVTGLAIDKDESGENYKLTFEIIDLGTAIKNSSLKSKIVESEGKTLIDAARNAKIRLENDLFFSNAQVIIIDHKIVEKEDLSNIIDWLLRDIKFRETINITISQEKTAKEILLKKGIDNPIISFEINKIVDKDSEITASSKNDELYRVHDILKSQGVSLVLPAIRQVMNNGEPVVEINGSAVFKGERMIGYLTPEESRYYLFVTDDIKGGILTLNSTEQGDQVKNSISLEIVKNKTKVKSSYSENKIKIVINTKTDVYLAETKEKIDVLSPEEIDKVETSAEIKLANEITNVIKKVQLEFNSDIFEFGNTIYKSDLKLWKQIGDDWDNLFPTIEVEVQSQINIINTASKK